MKFSGVTDEGGYIEFNVLDKDSDRITEYATEICVHRSRGHYVKKSTIRSVELEEKVKLLQSLAEEGYKLGLKHSCVERTVENIKEHRKWLKKVDHASKNE